MKNFFKKKKPEANKLGVDTAARAKATRLLEGYDPITPPASRAGTNNKKAKKGKDKERMLAAILAKQKKNNETFMANIKREEDLIIRQAKQAKAQAEADRQLAMRLQQSVAPARGPQTSAPLQLGSEVQVLDGGEWCRGVVLGAPSYGSYMVQWCGAEGLVQQGAKPASTIRAMAAPAPQPPAQRFTPQQRAFLDSMPPDIRAEMMANPQMLDAMAPSSPAPSEEAEGDVLARQLEFETAAAAAEGADLFGGMTLMTKSPTSGDAPSPSGVANPVSPSGVANPVSNSGVANAVPPSGVVANPVPSSFLANIVPPSGVASNTPPPPPAYGVVTGTPPPGVANASLPPPAYTASANGDAPPPAYAAPTSEGAPSAQPDSLAALQQKLRTAKEMFNEGLISDSEFAKVKKNILERLSSAV